MSHGRFCHRKELDLKLAAEELSLSRGFERLVSLDSLPLKLFPHQEKTVLKVLRQMRGRAVLADEVGLGKTIEAGVILREYLLRGLVTRALVLVPASLVTQWWEELTYKLRLPFVILATGGEWLSYDLVIASLDTAKRPGNAEAVQAAGWDLVIVDEAHKLKNEKTANWQFVNGLQKKFLLLLTATPIQNNLRELFNLITLLKPGQLDTYESFKREFVVDKHSVKNVERLRTILGEVMVRTTRRTATITLPRREVRTVSLELNGPNRAIYEETLELARLIYTQSGNQQNLLSLIVLLRELASSPLALSRTLEKMKEQKRWEPYKDRIARILGKVRSFQAGSSSLSPKDESLLTVLRKGPDKVLVFTEFRATQEHIRRLLSARGFSVVTYHGQMPPADKDASIAKFKHEAQVLVSTEAGGEGRNLQFCRVLINYDLPWNPMRIEQRIGRIHRLGQLETVHIINLITRDTIEDYVLYLLEKKIGLFRRVIGELDAILAGLNEQNFEAEIGKIVLGSPDRQSLTHGLKLFGDKFSQVVENYEENQRFNDYVLGGPIGLDEPAEVMV